MQKVLRQTAVAKSQAKRKARIIEEKEARRDWLAWRDQKGVITRETTLAIQAARNARRENWDLGPLSPWHNAMETNETYGTFTPRIMNPPKVPEKLRIKDWFIREGDRVCVIKGRTGVKGCIGKVTEVDLEAETVKIENVNLIDIRSPEVLVTEGQSRVQTTELPLPYSHVQLVYPLPDPITGIPRDVLLPRLVKRNAYFDIYKNEMVWQRYVEPQNVRIPWPAVDEPEYKDEDVDTLRIQVEDKSFLPTLLRPPMPPSVIDELRNKFSKFRDRHDDDYIAKKIKEDEEVAHLSERARLTMPRGARNMARTGHGHNEGKKMVPKLSDAALEKLGAHMAAKGSTLRKEPARPSVLDKFMAMEITDTTSKPQDRPEL